MQDISVEFNLEDNEKILTNFEFNANPAKLSELENDVEFTTKQEVEAGLDTKQDKGNYLTEHQDISHLATKEELEEAIGDIDFSELYTKTETNELLNAKQAKIEAVEPLKLSTKAVTAENKLEYVDGVVTITSDPYYSVRINMIPTYNSVNVGGTYNISTQMQRNILGAYESNSVTEHATISKDGLVNYTLHPFQFVTGQEIIIPYNYALGYFDEDLIFNAVIKNVNSTTVRDINNNIIAYYPILIANNANGYQMIDTTTSYKWKAIGCQRITHTILPSQMEKILAYSLYCDELAVGNTLTVKTYVDYRTEAQQVYTDTIALTEEMVSALSKINVALGLCLGVKAQIRSYTQAPITDADGNILYGTTKGSVNVDVLELEEVLPDQADNAGKFLMTDGETASWEKALTNNATRENYIAIGNNALTTEDEYGCGVSIGANANAQNNSVAVGGYAETIVAGGLAIGNNAKANNFDATTVYDENGIAIGANAMSTNAQAIAIGGDSQSNGAKSIAIGPNSTAKGEGAIVIGSNALSNSPNGANIVIGPNARISGYSINSIAIGIGTKAGNYDATAFGRSSSAGAQYSTAIGFNSETDTTYCDYNIDDSPSVLALGMGAKSRSNSTVAIGKYVYADGPFSTVIGCNSKVEQGHTNGIAIGNNAQVYAEGAVQLGEGQNYGTNSLQFQDKTLLYDNGTIPYERLAYDPPSNGQVLTYDEDQDALVWGNGGGGGISEIPVATRDTLGGVIVGNSLSIDEDGRLSSDVSLDLLDERTEALQDEISDIRSDYRDVLQDIQNLDNNIITNTANLQSQIDSLSSIGQFLAIWDCDTHTARYLTEGFEYQAGNYFIIGSVAADGGINYMPNGSSYPNYVETTEDVKVSDMWFFDGEHWIYLANHERAIAVDAELDINSSNPVENKAVATVLEELQNRPTGIGVPQLASVDVAQIDVEEAEERRVKYNDWMGLYSDIVVTLNLSKQDILDKMYDLYVTVSRFKTNKNLSYQYDNGGEDASQNYRNIPKFSVLNDLRQKTDNRLYCWRFVTDAGLSEANPQRYCYFYTKDNYDSVETLKEVDPQIGLWYNSEGASGIGTCFNAIGWFNHGYRANMYYQDYIDGGDIERYEEGDIDSFVNLRDSNYGDYNPADYFTKVHCRKYTKDGQNYFFWCVSWDIEDDETVYAYFEDGELIPNGIPKHFDMLSELVPAMSEFDALGYELVENRPDLNYRIINDFDMLLESLEELTFQGYGVGSNEPFEWKCYWFDYPVMPVLLKDCQVRLHEGGEWVKLEEVARKPWFLESLEDDIPLELKLPYNTYYLWMRFLAIQKRCTYGNPENWMEEEGREISSPMWTYQKNSLMEGIWNGVVSKAGFGARNSYRGASEFAKICEYIEFNLCEAKNVAHHSKSKATPIQKRLYLTGTGKSGLRN